MLTHEAIARIATDVLRSTLGSSGFERVILVGDDVESDGDPALTIVARFKPGSRPPNGQSAVKSLTRLREELRNAGDERFPLLRYDFPDDEIPYATDEDMKAWQ